MYYYMYFLDQFRHPEQENIQVKWSFPNTNTDVKVPVEWSSQLGNHGKQTKETCTFMLFSLDSYFISVVLHFIGWLIYLHDSKLACLSMYEYLQ
jgi:hypothetical protein